MKNAFLIFSLMSLLGTVACKGRKFNPDNDNGSGKIASTTNIPIKWPVLNIDGKEIELPYRVYEEYSANNCEFYVNAVATGSQYVYHGVGYFFFLSNIIANKNDLEAQGTRIMNTGMLVKYIDTGANFDMEPIEKEGLVLAGPVAGKLNEYEIKLTTDSSDTSGKKYKREIKSVSYFMDVLRSGEGGYVRLWLNDSGKPFTQASIFGDYKRNSNTGSTSLSWLDGSAPSPVFAQKKSCSR